MSIFLASNSFLDPHLIVADVVQCKKEINTTGYSKLGSKYFPIALLIRFKVDKRYLIRQEARYTRGYHGNLLVSNRLMGCILNTASYWSAEKSQQITRPFDKFDKNMDKYVCF